MIILLSPAKKIAQHPVPKGVQPTVPMMMDEADYLISKLKKYSISKIEKLMHVSNAIATLNYGRYQNWQLPLSDKNSWMAAYSFDGAAYWGLDARTLTAKEMSWATDHLRILSGLYGLLRPTDWMYPYRLEMGTKLQITPNVKNLYQYWGDKLAVQIQKELEQTKGKTIVNLASNEYFKAVKKGVVTFPIITPVFKDFSKGEYKTLMVYAKNARGAMTRYIIKNKISDVEQIKGFDYDGYMYNDRLSEGDQWVFTRDKVPGKVK